MLAAPNMEIVDQLEEREAINLRLGCFT